MSDQPDAERECALAGGRAGGKYLDGIGVFDLRQLSAEQFVEFCVTVCAVYHLEYNNRQLDRLGLPA